ncbi:hypothetical protein ABB37_00392 [Leptomonas pyrrhocoris]|uniref:Probable ubiquitin carboxyl-terminal hydrolase MINDY-4 n=1 Tax=Leptomonas pyrrhocoris TaxID=157538 RepID=A0A0N0E083_LEPPY|nr:hypothetical protein ABB37_00392 [Leptomonas pyrrhocoris]KPA86142.1 hypothetical protein ABB37_00392 [Leptomonas pyrrhocoris]|eukprot:XP_015664581.1 hypothetical protein ABB37_00392 [Leptomonas pyrrhocoris]
MPPKKLKDLSDAPVYTMIHEDQVQLLSDALLREYMHRRGFRATLKAFDEEHPRDDNTISSRAVMSDLMALQPDDQQRMKGEGIETIMEMLCNLRVERRVEVEKLTAEAAAPLPKVPAKYGALEAKLAERAARKERKQKHKGVKKMSALDEPTSGAGGERAKKSKAHARLPEEVAEAGMTIDDLLSNARSSSESASSGNDETDSEEEDTHQPHGLAKKTSTPAKKDRKSSGSNASPPTSSPSAAPAAANTTTTTTKPAGAPVQPAWMELENKATAKSGAGRSGSADSSDNGNAAAASSDDDESVDANTLGGDPLPNELRGELSAAFQLLCGFDGGLTRAFLEQGFTFDEDLDCALIQWRPGGCDAVVASVQAFVAAFFYEKEVYVKKEQRQRDCLLRAVSTVLEQAQPNAAKVVLLDGDWKLQGGQPRFTRGTLRQQASLTRTRCWTQLKSFEEVREVLRGTLLDEDRWMKPRGSGLLSFVFSLLLSRGVDVVQKELTAAMNHEERPSLLSTSTDGHATVALANLILSGRASSFCHNGMQNGNQMGYSAKLKCGMLLGDTPSTDADASLPSTTYTYAMDPIFPSWVLRHRNHYANLYMTKDTRQVFQQKLNLGGSAAQDLVFWDAATEDGCYILSVTVRSITLGGVGGGVRNAKSFVNTAITSVPVWSSAEVNWNGEAPLRD